MSDSSEFDALDAALARLGESLDPPGLRGRLREAVRDPVARERAYTEELRSLSRWAIVWSCAGLAAASVLAWVLFGATPKPSQEAVWGSLSPHPMEVASLARASEEGP